MANYNGFDTILVVCLTLRVKAKAFSVACEQLYAAAFRECVRPWMSLSRPLLATHLALESQRAER